MAMAMASGLRSHTEHCRPGDLLVVVRESPPPPSSVHRSSIATIAARVVRYDGDADSLPQMSSLPAAQTSLA
jgi:hypothetical protein